MEHWIGAAPSMTVRLCAYLVVPYPKPSLRRKEHRPRAQNRRHSSLPPDFLPSRLPQQVGSSKLPQLLGMSDIVIQVEGLGKQYLLRHLQQSRQQDAYRYGTLRDALAENARRLFRSSTLD